MSFFFFLNGYFKHFISHFVYKLGNVANLSVSRVGPVTCVYNVKFGENV